VNFEEIFETDVTLKDAAKRLGMSQGRLKRLWRERFGVEAVEVRGVRLKKGASPEAVQEAMEAFHGDEPFKAISKRLGISPDTLRAKWVDAHGAEAFKARGKRLQQLGADAYGVRTKGVPKSKTLVKVACDVCRESVELSKQRWKP